MERDKYVGQSYTLWKIPIQNINHIWLASGAVSISRVGDYYPTSNTKLPTYHLSVVETLLSGQLASLSARHNARVQGGVI